MKRAAVFDATLKNYLAQIGGVDLQARADRLGATVSEGALLLLLYKIPYRVSGQGVFDADGQRADFAVSVVLCRYILQCPDTVPAPGAWMTYRGFRDAAPLTGYFTANSNTVIETTFAGRLAPLRDACHRRGGRIVDEPSFDLAVAFDFLPRIPVALRFNDRDDEFPAQSLVLFRQSAEHYLDMECLSIGGTLLARLLVDGAAGNKVEKNSAGPIGQAGHLSAAASSTGYKSGEAKR
ncbi:MAG: DUF3786 domain-containing protein [Desulfobacterales bacterium]